MKKKVLSWMLILCLVVTLMPLTGVKADATTYNKSRIQSKLTNMMNGKTYNGIYKLNSSYGYRDCFKFAQEVFYNVFGHTPDNINYHGKYYYANNADTIKLVGRCYKSCSNCCNIDPATSTARKYTTTLNKSNVNALIKKMAPGDLLQGVGIGGVNNSNGQHTAIVYSVDSSAGTVTIYDANGWGDNIVRKRTLDASDLMAYNFGHSIAVYRSNRSVTAIPWVDSLKITNSAKTGKPKLTWSKYSGASKYYVYRKTGVNGTYKYLTSTQKRSYADNSAVASYNYYYKIKAVKSNGKGLKTTEGVGKTCNLASPEITSISNVASTGAIVVKWKDVKNANQYHVYRATSKSGAKDLIAIYDVAMNTGKTYSCINSNNITPGKTYYYWIKAVNTNNTSAASQYYYYDYRTCDLSRPVVSVNAREDGKPVISWNSVSSADKYQVYRAVKGGSYSKIATVTGTTVTNTKNLTNGKVYYYKVRALDNSVSAATSAFSEPVSMKYINKVIGLVSESTYHSKYSDSNKYNAVPYYRYKTRTMQTTTSTSPSLSGWDLVTTHISTKVGPWTTTKPSGNYETTQAYYYYSYVCNCQRYYWKSTKSDTCASCKTKMKNLLRVYSQNDPSKYYKKDTDGSYFTPKTISTSSPGSFGTIYRMTYKGSSISKFTSTSKKNTSFLWPSSAYRVTLYRTKTSSVSYVYQKLSDWSDWSSWTTSYINDSETSYRDPQVKYYITIK